MTTVKRKNIKNITFSYFNWELNNNLEHLLLSIKTLQPDFVSIQNAKIEDISHISRIDGYNIYEIFASENKPSGLVSLCKKRVNIIESSSYDDDHVIVCDSIISSIKLNVINTDSTNQNNLIKIINTLDTNIILSGFNNELKLKNVWTEIGCPSCPQKPPVYYKSDLLHINLIKLTYNTGVYVEFSCKL
jgi:hypothetical protein